MRCARRHATATWIVHSGTQQVTSHSCCQQQCLLEGLGGAVQYWYSLQARTDIKASPSLKRKRLDELHTDLRAAKKDATPVLRRNQTRRVAPR